MKIVFNDAAEMQVQQVYIDPAGALRIKTISVAQEELVRIFLDPEKTKKITVQERGQILAEYERYIQFEGIMSYTAGILEPILYKEGETPAEKIDRLEAEKQALQDEVGMLKECILEMSERVYQ
ncbi:hypothetical protein AALA13_05160 [Lachnospiraceae bacterium 50-23]